jgi:hypothetical protein
LLVEDKPLSTVVLLRETLSSARSRISSALAYSASGHASHSDVCCALGPNAEAYVRQMLSDSIALLQLPEPRQAQLLQARERLAGTGRVVEHYRRLSPGQCLRDADVKPAALTANTALHRGQPSICGNNIEF